MPSYFKVTLSCRLRWSQEMHSGMTNASASPTLHPCQICRQLWKESREQLCTSRLPSLPEQWDAAMDRIQGAGIPFSTVCSSRSKLCFHCQFVLSWLGPAYGLWLEIRMMWIHLLLVRYGNKKNHGFFFSFTFGFTAFKIMFGFILRERKKIKNKNKRKEKMKKIINKFILNLF